MPVLRANEDTGRQGIELNKYSYDEIIYLTNVAFPNHLKTNSHLLASMPVATLSVGCGLLLGASQSTNHPWAALYCQHPPCPHSISSLGALISALVSALISALLLLPSEHLPWGRCFAADAGVQRWCRDAQHPCCHCCPRRTGGLEASGISHPAIS